MMVDTPEITYYPVMDYESPSGRRIRALFYKGLDFNGHVTRVFAYLGVPAHAAPESPVPAVVLVHGGLGTAFAEWVDLWVGRGYAAIAMDTDNNIPDSPGSREYSPDEPTLSGPLREGNFEGIDRPMKSQWMYSAVSKVRLANSLLRSIECIDRNKIGLTGISWGGLISSIAICRDSRFAFAIPVYGCGFLQESRGIFKTVLTPGKVASTWDPGQHFKSVNIPTLWINSDHDPFFSADANSKSAEAARGQLTILPDLEHGHIEGWTPSEIYRFADSVVMNGSRLIRITRQPNENMGNTARVDYEIPQDLTLLDAVAFYRESDIEYKQPSSGNWELMKEWKSMKAMVDPLEHTITAILPFNARVYYINVIGTDGKDKYVSSTRVVSLAEA